MAGCEHRLVRRAQGNHNLVGHLEDVHLIHVDVYDEPPKKHESIFDISPMPNPHEPNTMEWNCNNCNHRFKDKRNAARHCQNSRRCGDWQGAYATANSVWSNARNYHPMVNRESKRKMQNDTYKHELRTAGLDFAPADNDVVVSLNGEPLKVVDNFKYLGRILCADNCDSAALKARMGISRKTYFALHRSFLRHKHVKTETRIEVWRSIVFAQLTYATETMVITRRAGEQLDVMHRRQLRQITGVQTYKDNNGNIRYPKDSRVYRAANSAKITNDIKLQKLRFYGHILRRQPGNDLPFLLKAKIATFRTCASRSFDKGLAVSLHRLGRVADVDTQHAQLRSLWRDDITKFHARLREADQQ